MNERIQDIIDRLTVKGCRGRIVDDEFVVDGVPDWQTRREIEDILPELALVAVAKNIFGTPHAAQPIAEDEADCEGKGNRCNHCLHFHLYQCGKGASKTEPTPATQETGCQQFLFTHTYF